MHTISSVLSPRHLIPSSILRLGMPQLSCLGVPNSQSNRGSQTAPHKTLLVKEVVMVVIFLLVFSPVVREFTQDVGDPGSAPHSAWIKISAAHDEEKGIELKSPTCWVSSVITGLNIIKVISSDSHFCVELGMLQTHFLNGLCRQDRWDSGCLPLVWGSSGA